jgi:hypothetical protein
MRVQNERKDRTMPALKQREERNGWALDEQHMPTKVIGYACPDDYWWCPAIGWSIAGSKLYANEADARARAIRELTIERESIDQRLARLSA